MAIAVIFISFLDLFSELGIRTRLIQIERPTREFIRAVYGVSIVTNMALSILLALASPFIADYFQQEKLSFVLLALAAQYAFSSVGVIPDAMLKRELKFAKIAAIDATQAVVAATLTLLLAWLGLGVWSLVLGTTAGTVVRCVGLVLASPFKDMPTFKFDKLDGALRFGGLVVSQRIVWWIYTNIDRVIVAKLFSVHSLGVYTAGSQFASMPISKVGGMINLLAFAGLSRVEDQGQFKQMLIKMVTLVSVPFFAMGFGIAAIASEASDIIFGPKWAGTDVIMIIFALSLPATALRAPLQEALNAMGKPELGLKCVLATALATVVGVVLGYIVFSNTVGVAVGWSLAANVAMLIVVSVVARSQKFNPTELLKPMLIPFCIGSVMYFLVIFARAHIPLSYPSIEGVGTSILIGSAFYVISLYGADRGAFDLCRSLLPRTPWSKSG